MPVSNGKTLYGYKIAGQKDLETADYRTAATGPTSGSAHATQTVQRRMITDPHAQESVGLLPIQATATRFAMRHGPRRDDRYLDFGLRQ